MPEPALPATPKSAAPTASLTSRALLSANEYECVLSVIHSEVARCGKYFGRDDCPLQRAQAIIGVAECVTDEATGASVARLRYTEFTVYCPSAVFTNMVDGVSRFGSGWHGVNCDIVDQLGPTLATWSHLRDPVADFSDDVSRKAHAVVAARTHVQLHCRACGSDVNYATWHEHVRSSKPCRDAAVTHAALPDVTDALTAPWQHTDFDEGCLKTVDMADPDAPYLYLGHSHLLLKDAQPHELGGVNARPSTVPFSADAVAGPVSASRALRWMINIAHGMLQVINRHQLQRHRFPSMLLDAAADDLRYDAAADWMILAVRPRFLPRDPTAAAAAMKADVGRCGTVLKAIWATAQRQPESNTDLDAVALATAASRVDAIVGRATAGALNIDEVVARLCDAQTLLLGATRSSSIMMDPRAYTALRDVVCTAVADAMQTLAPTALPLHVAGDAPLPGFPPHDGWTFGVGARLLKSGPAELRGVQLWAEAMLVDLSGADADATQADLVAASLKLSGGLHVAQHALELLRPGAAPRLVARDAQPDDASSDPSNSDDESGKTRSPVASSSDSQLAVPATVLDDALAILAKPSTMPLAWCETCRENVPRHALSLHRRRHHAVIQGVSARLRRAMMQPNAAVVKRAQALCHERGVAVTLGDDASGALHVWGRFASLAANELVQLLGAARIAHQPYGSRVPH